MHAVPTSWLLLSLYEELFDPPPAFSFLQEKNTTEEVISRKKRNRVPFFIIMKLGRNLTGI
jgi:hypothetical protein